MLSQFSNILPVPTAIAIIKEIEEEYPTWTTVQLIDNLRYVSSLDSKLSQTLFGSGNGASFLPKGKLTKVDLDSLTSTLTQKTLNKNGLHEVGVSVDSSTGRKVALGHAISGISAAIYHYERLIDGQSIELLRGVRFSLPVLKIDGLLPTSINSPTNFEFRPQVVGIDSLYAMTIAGDIARTVTGQQTLWKKEAYPIVIGGIGTEASSAEIYGNIDGFWLGSWLRTNEVGEETCMRMQIQMNDENTVKLSAILGEYYGTVLAQNRRLNMTSGFGTSLVANLRFSNFLGMLRSTDFRLNMLLQSIVYQLLDASFNKAGKSSFENTIKSYTAFEAWCVSEFNKLRNASIQSKKTGKPFSSCINESSDLNYLSLGNYFISELNNSDPDSKTDVRIVDLANRDWLSISYA